MRLPSHWTLFNFRTSPFALEFDHDFLPDLVVGRDDVIEALLTQITTTPNARVLLTGAPGVGASTVGLAVRHAANGAGYLVGAEPITLVAGDTAETVATRCMRAMYEALLSYAGSQLADEEALHGVRQFLQVQQLTTCAAGGTGVDRPTFLEPTVLLPTIISDLAHVATDHLACRGFVLQVEVAPAVAGDVAAVAALLTDLEEVLETEGVAWLLVDRADVFAQAAAARPAFGERLVSMPLPALPAATVWEALWRRCAHVAIDPAQPASLPLSADAVGSLYDLFDGDLRGFFTALEQAARAQGGYTDPYLAPLTAAQVLPVLHAHYRRAIAITASTIGGVGVPQGRDAMLALLDSVLAAMPALCFAPGDLCAPWSPQRPSVDAVLAALQAHGALRLVARRDGEPIYGVTGTTRLLVTPALAAA